MSFSVYRYDFLFHDAVSGCFRNISKDKIDDDFLFYDASGDLRYIIGEYI